MQYFVLHAYYASISIINTLWAIYIQNFEANWQQAPFIFGFFLKEIGPWATWNRQNKEKREGSFAETERRYKFWVCIVEWHSFTVILNGV